MEKIRSRFATKEELLEDRSIKKIDIENLEESGIPVGFENGNFYIDTGCSHTLVIGSTGSGKTQAITLPLLKSCILAEESFATIDVKGELFEQLGSSLEERGYKNIVIDFNDNNLGNKWNPFTLIKHFYNNGNKRKANIMLRQIANQIFRSENANVDPFWENSAANYFLGLANILLELDVDFTFKDIYYLSEIGNTKDSFLKKYYTDNTNVDSYIFIKSIIDAPNETKGSIISVFNAKMNRYIIDEGLMDLISTTDFDLIGSDFNKTAIFIVLPEFESYSSMYTILLRQIYEKVITEKDNKRFNGRFSFMLDDYFKCSPIDNLDILLSSSRGRNIRFTICHQSLEELYEMYGREVGEKIKYQFYNILYLLSNSIETLTELSEYCGKDYENDRNLITVEELRTLKNWQALLIRVRQYPFITYLNPDYKNDWNFEVKDVNIEVGSEPFRRTMEELKEIIFTKVGYKKDDKSFDVDDLVKKIDDKIKELEELEKTEK